MEKMRGRISGVNKNCRYKPVTRCITKLFLCSFIIGLVIFVSFVPQFTQASTGNCNFKLQQAKDAIRIIEQELSAFDGTKYPSKRLREAIQSLDHQLKLLGQDKECHCLTPPSLDKLGDLCNKIGSTSKNQILQGMINAINYWTGEFKNHSEAYQKAYAARIKGITKVLWDLWIQAVPTPAGVTFVMLADTAFDIFQPTGRSSMDPYIQRHKHKILSIAKSRFFLERPDATHDALSKRKHQKAFIIIILEETELYTLRKRDEAHQNALRLINEKKKIEKDVNRFNDIRSKFMEICQKMLQIELQLWTPVPPCPPPLSPPPATAVDNQGPDLSITSHNEVMPWSRVATRSITLAGTATDMNRGDNGIQSVHINSSLADSGSTATGNGTANWGEEVSLNSGWNKITIEAYDNSSNFNKTIKTIWIYFDAPDLPDEPVPPLPPGAEQAPFSAELDCGDSFELAPGDFAGRGCGIVVRGWQNTDERVKVDIEYDESSGIEIFPGDWSAHPMNMFNPGVSDYYDRYIFSESFRANETAPPGITTITITVGQVGAGTVILTLTIAVLPEGQMPSSGTGIRPPAETATGTAVGSPDAYCVWRYKSFGDPPPCFNFVRAECDTPRYSSSRYELVGSGMTRMESAVRMAELGSYHDDAYGCHTSTETDDGTDVTGPEDNGRPPDGTGQEPTTEQEVRTVSALTISPVSVDLRIGGSQSFTAMVVYSDNSTEVVPGAQWSGGDGNSFIASQVGTFTITATYRGISGSAKVNVQEPSMSSITVSPSTITIKVGETARFSARAQFDAGDPKDVTGEATWFPGTQFTGMEAGTYIITAEYRGKSGTATVTVREPIVTSVTVSPARMTIQIGKTIYFSAIAGFDDGSTKSVTGEASWSPGSSFTGATIGTFPIVANYQGKTDEASVTVEQEESAGGTDSGCPVYDPTDPACEPNLQAGNRPPVDPNIGDPFQGSMPGSQPSEQDGVMDGGESVPQGTYAEPPEREPRECELPYDCPAGQICENGKCVTDERGQYPPYGQPPDGVGTGTDWTDWATSGQRPTGGPNPKEPEHKPKPKPKAKSQSTATQSSTSTVTGKDTGCNWVGTIWQISGIDWKCYCSGKEQSYSQSTKLCGSYPPSIKKNAAQKVDGSKFGLDVWYGMWDKANNRCILWGKDAVVLKESKCRKIGMK